MVASGRVIKIDCLLRPESDLPFPGTHGSPAPRLPLGPPMGDPQCFGSNFTSTASIHLILDANPIARMISEPLVAFRIAISQARTFIYDYIYLEQKVSQ